MRYSVRNISDKYDFYIDGASYAGEPRNNTMMYISKKVEYLVLNLKGKSECLVFVENGMDIPDGLQEKNCFVFSSNPQFEYAKFANQFAQEQRRTEKEIGYTLTTGGYYIGANVTIGANAYIEPGVLIGHNVHIGHNAVILAGAIVKHAEIGDNFLCNENAVIGDYSFTMAEDINGNKFRIPSLGRVIIKNNVEVGACNDVAIGACGDTILEDFVKLDGLVHVGHEAHLRRNTEVTAGAIIAGFVDMEERSYLGVNCSIKNRIHLGANCIVGMGSNVTKSVEANLTVVGNPAKPLARKE
jgi:UDP-3-O-[3-hydroxymyristoyl] glucosamine N-acyltransferase